MGPSSLGQVERQGLVKLYPLGWSRERVRFENSFSSIRYGTVRFRHFRQARRVFTRTR